MLLFRVDLEGVGSRDKLHGRSPPPAFIEGAIT